MKEFCRDNEAKENARSIWRQSISVSILPALVLSQQKKEEKGPRA
jgi:hypothetical protein